MALTYLDSKMIETPATVQSLSSSNFTTDTLQAVTINTTNLHSNNLNFPVAGGSIINNTGLFGNLTVYGAITALSGFNIVSSSTTTTSALSVVGTGLGPALYVSQDISTSPILSINSKNAEILRVNSSLPDTGQTGVVINYPGNGSVLVVGPSSAPNAFVVNSSGNLIMTGVVSAQNITPSLVTTTGGNSDQWNSTYTTVNTYSASWEETLDIIPTITNYLSTSNVEISSIVTKTNQPMTFSTSNTERLRILGTGNVGIGTTSPGSTLTVNGSISAKNNLFIGNNVALFGASSAGTRCIIAGSNNTVNNDGTNNFIFGNLHNIGGYTSFTTILGQENQTSLSVAQAENSSNLMFGKGNGIGGYVYQCVVGGYNNLISGGTGVPPITIYGSTAIGWNCKVIGGYGGITSGIITGANAEGHGTLANGTGSHAEGYTTLATGQGSHAEGQNTTASGNGSHAEGFNTTAAGQNSHAAGQYCQAYHSVAWIWKGSPNTNILYTTRAYQFMVSATGGAAFYGNVGIGTDSIANALTVVGNTSSTSIQTTNLTATNLVTLSTSAPTLSTDSGIPGTFKWDVDYLYICVAANTWKRVALSAWN